MVRLRSHLTTTPAIPAPLPRRGKKGIDKLDGETAGEPQGFGFRVSGFGPLAGEFSRGDRYPFGSDDLMDMLSS